MIAMVQDCTSDQLEHSPSKSIKSRHLLASFRRRMVCTLLDVIIALGIVFQAGQLIGGWLGVATSELSPALVGLIIVYFGGFWASPLSATPAQFLLGLRVVTTKGDRLPIGRSLLRGCLMVALVAAALTILGAPEQPLFFVLGGVAFICLFLSAVTLCKQALHDFVVASIVVRRKVLAQTGAMACLEALEGEKREPSPTVLRIRSDDLMLDVLSIGVLLLLLVVTVPVFHTKNLMARV